MRELVLPLGQLSLITGANGRRYLLWAAWLLPPRPPQLMVLNEPETSLHPDVLSALARLILAAAEQTQIIVVSHAPQLIEVLTAASMCVRVHLVKEFGETTLEGATLFNKPNWVWPGRERGLR